jgi:hypothetical protein
MMAPSAVPTKEHQRSKLSEAAEYAFHYVFRLWPRACEWGMNRDDLLKGQVGNDDSGDAKWEPDVGGYLGDRMQSLITQVERKPLFGVEMHRGAHRASKLGCLDQSLEREINSCPGASAGDDVRANDGADVIVITSVHETEPFAGAHTSLTRRGRGR